VNSPSQIALPHDGLREPEDATRILMGQFQDGTTGPRPVPVMARGSAPVPAIGATAPVPVTGSSAGAPASPRRAPPVIAADPRATSKKKGVVPAPGFSN
jgi:pilus assembly protein CpaC